MSLTAWRQGLPFDPGARALPHDLTELIEQAAITAPVVLLVAGAVARRGGWAPRAALALARDWSRVAEGVVLADLTVGEPDLHELAGVPEDEGLADVFLFGASIRHVRHPVPGESFTLIPGGLAPAELETVLRHPRWQSVVAEFFRTAEALLVYVPAEAPGLDELARRIGCGLALVSAGDDETLARALPDEFAVLSTLAEPETRPAEGARAEQGAVREAPEESAPAATADSAAEAGPAAETLLEGRPAPEATSATEVRQEPAAAAAPATPSEAPPPPPPPGGVRSGPEPSGVGAVGTPAHHDQREALVDALWARRGAGAEAAREAASVKPDPVPGREVSEEDLLDEPPMTAREPSGRRKVSLLLWLALGAAVTLGIVFGAQEYFGYDILGGLFGRAAAPAVGKAAAARAAPPPHSVARPLPYSVAIEARQSYASALERLAELQKAEPALQFFVSPVRADGNVLFYRIMAGPVADSTAAAILMQRLLEAGVKTGASQWDIRPTPWSFLLGEFASRDAAAARADSLGAANIPTYIVQVPYSVGPPHWRLYGGAFEGPAQAEVLRPLLRGAGVADTLVERTGRSVP